VSAPPDDEHGLRKQAKAELRRRMRAVRRVMPEDARRVRAQALAAHVLALAEYAGAKTLAVYVAVRGEADPTPVVEAALGAGKTIALPRVEGAGIVFHRWSPDAALVESADLIPEPAADAPIVAPDAIDLVLVPALAVDARGHRIGYGRGYYDRLLPTLVHAHKVAFVYDFQLLAELPDTTGDVRVDRVVTDRRVIPVLP
jgi:5-formyltetrahydrofolate cyclo-ligase